MPITFSVTCDTDAELARFLENVKLNASLSKTSPKGESAVNSPSQETHASTSSTATTAAPAKRGPKPKAAGLKLAKAPKASAGRPKSESTPGLRPGRKPGKLIPLIEESIDDMIKKGKPFRSKEVIELVMHKAPDLNASSVTTGVSKLLSESTLGSEQIKDAVGRPYKLYKPKK